MKRATEGEQEESITGADRLHEAMESAPVTSKNKAANMHCDAVLGVQIGQNISGSLPKIHWMQTCSAKFQDVQCFETGQ
ncbi:hypothetical protein E5288_WYG004535 [Bos mutus]|uniref:Uncharacterized protein n=1 Tax=Bos mutus TaxID=72004 RepID=A0A6B0RV00_9CETA|nr:hypothetical protein [Bos mutus]